MATPILPFPATFDYPSRRPTAQALRIKEVLHQRGSDLCDVEVDELNRHLRRGLHTRDGDYRVPLELVHERLRGRR